MTLTRYTFDVDGQAYGQYMGELLYQRAALESPLPRGMRAQIPEAYRNMTGTGELWIDADGLPSRMAMMLDYSGQENGERVSAELQTDFSNFNRNNIISVPFFSNPRQWITINADAIVGNAQSAAIATGALVLLTFTVLFVLRYHSRRSFYIGYVSLIIFSMVFLPIIDGAVAYAFMNHHEQSQAAYDARVAKAQEQQAIRDTVYGIDNQQDSAAFSTNSVGGSYSAGQTLETLYALQTTSDTTDTDNDGLSNEDEVNKYLTDPTLSDTDSDGIWDGLEVVEFEFGGEVYQFDATDTDTNNDGLTDGEECMVWVYGSPDYDPEASCPDTDGDGVPDAFEIDNDNDGVFDSVDISPNSKVDQVYTNDNPLKLSIDNLAVDQPVIVQFDFRPTTDVNLTFSGHVLDWPVDELGQIQRRLETTFADTDNLDARSSDENAANGDIRITPMLEIQMPYGDGHYSNLPVLDSAPASRVVGNAVDTWLDTSELEGYGITMMDADVDSGLLSTYLPLASVLNDGGTVQAYSALMYYQPSQGTNDLVDWGEAHQYRLIWMVQMLTDECIDASAHEDDCDRQDVLDIIHVYHDEWRLTGISISEEHGTETAVVYEQPSEQYVPTTPNALVALAWNMSNSFLNGYDCDLDIEDSCVSDGTREVTIETLDSTIDLWTGGNSNLVAVYNEGDHRDQAAKLFSADTTTILEDEFTAYADQTDPSLLYLQETTYRTLSLDAHTISNGALTFDFDGVSQMVGAAMSLTTYTYDNGWDVYDAQDYIT